MPEPENTNPDPSIVPNWEFADHGANPANEQGQNQETNPPFIKRIGDFAVKSSGLVGRGVWEAIKTTGRTTARAAETAGRSAEQATRYLVEEGRLAVSGIMQAARARRLQKVNKKIDHLTKSLGAHRVAAAMTLVEGRPAAETEEDEQDWASRGEAIVEAYSNTFRPVTLSQRQQGIRAERRLRKNMHRAVKNSNLKLSHENIDSHDFTETLRQERLTGKERRHARHAHHEYHKNARKISRPPSGGTSLFRRAPGNTGKVTRSAAGQDIPGRIIRWRLKRWQDLANLVGAPRTHSDGWYTAPSQLYTGPAVMPEGQFAAELEQAKNYTSPEASTATLITTETAQEEPQKRKRGRGLTNPENVLNLKRGINRELAEYLLNNPGVTSDHLKLTQVQSSIAQRHLEGYFGYTIRQLEDGKVPQKIQDQVNDLLEKPLEELERLAAEKQNKRSRKKS